MPREAHGSWPRKHDIQNKDGDHCIFVPENHLQGEYDTPRESDIGLFSRTRCLG